MRGLFLTISLVFVHKIFMISWSKIRALENPFNLTYFRTIEINKEQEKSKIFSEFSNVFKIFL